MASADESSRNPWAKSPCRPGVDPHTLALEDFDPANPDLFSTDSWGPFFARLRDEAPVHHCRASPFGPYWSVTRFRDIQYVDSRHELFSSEPTIVLADPPSDFLLQPGFIAMDPPGHGDRRRAVQPVVAPSNLERLEPGIRSNAAAILDALPLGEDFDWVQRVAIELTTRMLATLFGMPHEDRHKLARWSDVATTGPSPTGRVDMKDALWRETMLECLDYFQSRWTRRPEDPRETGLDFLGLLARDPATRSMSAMELLGTLILLIVGGNDTTRNALSGGVLALAQNPSEYEKLRADPQLLASMVPEIIRWQTPLAYMRRRARCDIELGGQRIRAGDKVLMWYISGNRDEREIPEADRFLIDRPRARHHLAFGFGIHRCMGNRLAEMQLRIAWEEILKRFDAVELRGEPVRVRSSFVHGYERLPVRLHPRR